MICIILVAGHGFLLEKEIQEDLTGEFSDLVGVPKALLPAQPQQWDTREAILDKWWGILKSRQQFTDVYLVTNADKEMDLFTCPYVIADLELTIRCKKIEDDIMVVAGDMLFDHDFDLSQVVKYFYIKSGNLAIYYEMEEGENPQRRGILEVEPSSNRITAFYEKPTPGVTSSRYASVVFYFFKRSTLPKVGEFLHSDDSNGKYSFGHFMHWLVNKDTVFGMKLPSGFQLIGQIGLSEYKKWVNEFAERRKKVMLLQGEPIVFRTYARVGLMGNPSDGFYGKTIAMSIANFWAEVTLTESTRLKLLPHPLNDPTEFGGLADLHAISRKEGYLGGLRLLQATCKRFYQCCAEKGIALAKKNFTLKYDTNIPRQVGLAGSSAIVTSALKCLMKFYQISELDLPKEEQPTFVLNVEKSELFIQAGLQDRVVQVYGGLIFMDFNKELMKSRGYGEYEQLDTANVPPLWLAYVGDPSDSGKIHSNVRERWDRGEEDVHKAMEEFAKLTNKGKKAILSGDFQEFGKLMDENFNLRRQIYGDDALGATNLDLIEIARKHGSAAKFPGSGGAVIGCCNDENAKITMKEEFQSKGYVFCDIIPFPKKKEI